MDTTIGKSITKGTDADADSSLNPFTMLVSKCEVIECSSTMYLGVHNRCSFEVKLKMKSKTFIAHGSTLDSAKKKASLAALRDNEITEMNSLKSLDFEHNDLSGLDMQDSTNFTPEEHIDTNITNVYNLEENEKQCIGNSTPETSNHECIRDELPSERKKLLLNATEILEYTNNFIKTNKVNNVVDDVLLDRGEKRPVLLLDTNEDFRDPLLNLTFADISDVMKDVESSITTVKSDEDFNVQTNCDSKMEPNESKDVNTKECTTDHCASLNTTAMLEVNTNCCTVEVDLDINSKEMCIERSIKDKSFTEDFHLDESLANSERDTNIDIITIQEKQSTITIDADTVVNVTCKPEPYMLHPCDGYNAEKNLELNCNTKQTDLELFVKTDQENIFNVELSTVLDSADADDSPVITELISEESMFYNNIICMPSPLTKQLPQIIISNDCNVHSSATIEGNLNKDSDFDQINETELASDLVVANSDVLPIVNNIDTVPNPFVRKPIRLIAKRGSRKPSQKHNTNLLKLNKKIKFSNVSAKVGVTKIGLENMNTKQSVLNPFVKKSRVSNSSKKNSNYTSKINKKTARTNVNNIIAVVDLVEEAVTKPKKRKADENVMIHASKRIKLEANFDQVAAATTVKPLDKDTDINEENTLSTASESTVDLIAPTFLAMDNDTTADISLKREEAINHCLSLLLSDDENSESVELECASPLVEKTATFAVEIDEMDGTNLNECVNTTKELPSKDLARNPINLNADVMEVPTTANTLPKLPTTPIIKQQTPKFKKLKTPSKNGFPKIKTNSSNIIKPRFHTNRQRYLQELASIRKRSSWAKKHNTNSNPRERLNAICPGINYQLESKMGPSNSPFFVLSATLNGRKFYGHGKTKNLAQCDAAEQILETLQQGSTPKLQTLNSDDIPSTSNNHRNNDRVESSENHQNRKHQQHVPKNRRVFYSHSDSHKNHGKYGSPRHKRVVKVLPHEQLSNNNNRGYNFENASLSSMNFHFANGQSLTTNANNNLIGIFEENSNSECNFYRNVRPNYSEDLFVGVSEFNFPGVGNNIWNGMPYNHQFAGNQFNSPAAGGNTWNGMTYNHQFGNDQFNGNGAWNGMPNNHQFAGENCYIRGPQFNTPVAGDNIWNAMLNNQQFTGQHLNQMHFNNNNRRHKQRRATNSSRNYRRNYQQYGNRYPRNPKVNYDPSLKSRNQRHMNISDNNIVTPQPSRPRSQCLNPEPPTYNIPDQLESCLNTSDNIVTPQTSRPHSPCSSSELPTFNIPNQFENCMNISDNIVTPQPSRPRSQCLNPEPPVYNIPNQFEKYLHLPQADSDIMQQLILERYEQLTQSRPEVGNYKVLAGIVMTRHLNFQNAKVIAVATGTKCINGGNINCQGTVINDSHAEVIARRCLMKFLYTQLKYHCHPKFAKDSIFLRNPTGVQYAFTLKPQVQFHLYISTAPCGDARVFSSTDDSTNNLIAIDHNHGQLRTKVEGDMGTNRIGNQYLHQTWDGIQIGDRLHTMSCSDKIARWNVLGVQGGLLATLTEPIYLSSIVLGSMFNTRHLYRAVCGRLEQSLNFLPTPFRLNRPLLGQTSKACVLRSTERTPCIGVNWTLGDKDIEIISLPAGREITNKSSFLCKKVFFQKFIYLIQNLPDMDVSQMPSIYANVKLIAHDFQIAKQELFDAFQHAELGCWVKKPTEQNEFSALF